VKNKHPGGDTLKEDEKSANTMEYASRCDKQSNLLLIDIDDDGVPDYVQVRIKWIIAGIISVAGTCMTFFMH